MLFLGVDVILDKKKKCLCLSKIKNMLELRNGLIVTIPTTKKHIRMALPMTHIYLTNPDPITIFSNGK